MIDFLRGIVRPTITWVSWAVLASLMLSGKPVPDWYIGVVGTITGFWFGSRGSKPPSNGNGV